MPDTAPHAAASADPNRQTHRTLADDLAILDEHAENTLAALTTHLELQAERGIKAWLLAPTIPIYEALMRGESVPADRLRSEHLHRYGWRT